MPALSAWAKNPSRPIPQEVRQQYADLLARFGAQIKGGLSRARAQALAGVSNRTITNLYFLLQQDDPRLGSLSADSPCVEASEAEADEATVKEVTYTPSHEDVQAPVITFEQFLERVDVDLDTWQCVQWSPGTHAVPIKLKGENGTDRVEVHRMWGHRARFERRPIPLSSVPPWPSMFPEEGNPAGGGNNHTEAPAAASPAAPSPVETILIVPDLQVGYRWSEKHDVLTPMHDRRCMDLYLQVARRLKPSRVLLLGDNLDLAPWSTRFPRGLDLAETTTPSLLALGMWLRALRVAVGAAPIHFIAGNHEERISKALVEKLPELSRLRAVGASAPLLSVPTLLGLEQAGVDYIGPYGEGMWVPGLDDALRVLHGVRVKGSPGGTSAAVLRDMRHSAVFGHIHRVEAVHDTIDTPHGRRLIGAGSPGCGCRIDGAVPGHPGQPNWQQGVGFAYVDREAGSTTLDMVPIREGRLLMGGTVLVGEDYAEREGTWTGYEQVARGRCTA